MINKSLPNHPECPLERGRVRGSMNYLGFLLRPTVDQKTGQSFTNVFMVTWCDINGSVPKFFINNFSANIPKENFKELEGGAIAYAK